MDVRLLATWAPDARETFDRTKEAAPAFARGVTDAPLRQRVRWRWWRRKGRRWHGRPVRTAEALPIRGADGRKGVDLPKLCTRIDVKEALHVPALATAARLVAHGEAGADHHLDGGGLDPLR
eukprot:CAMPEP_0119353568 /NCGR_PEP_ID=MMETSP1334-20130426/2688_1 /TAXON_ID=127549 /ORGANISM="Calcidiscus leptoporus, Strain RCC1130" /LENGTH=121 /DNA_ID=CAMNT_0007366875 /DNA_START=56 /DNA_END=418 /DNA_ORIENTATION=+